MVRQSSAAGETGETCAMKTVLSLHRKWAHAVKTIRILQGLVSAVISPNLGVGPVAGVTAFFFLLVRRVRLYFGMGLL